MGCHSVCPVYYDRKFADWVERKDCGTLFNNGNIAHGTVVTTVTIVIVSGVKRPSPRDLHNTSSAVFGNRQLLTTAFVSSSRLISEPGDFTVRNLFELVAKQTTAVPGKGDRGCLLFGGRRDCDGGVAGE